MLEAGMQDSQALVKKLSLALVKKLSQALVKTQL
jgi:hypothetical protein